jgi:hypothetical protein
MHDDERVLVAGLGQGDATEEQREETEQGFFHGLKLAPLASRRGGIAKGIWDHAQMRMHPRGTVVATASRGEDP